MAGKGTVTIKVAGDASHFEKTMSGVEGTLSKLGGGLKKFAAAGAAAGGAAVAAGAVIGKQIFEMGASLEAMDAKAKTVFGDQIGLVDTWAKKNAAAMGLTKTEARGLATNFADLLVPMGFTRQQAAKMSTDVVGLSGALAEWSGGTKSAAEVADILSKAMLGETDGLKALGISISAADVEARLAAKGQQNLTGAAREQAEALAVQELILAKSTDAQKAYASGTAKGLRAQSEFKAKVGEVKEAIARGLYPVITQLITQAQTLLGPAVDTAKRAFEAIKPVIETVRLGFNAFLASVREGDVTSDGFVGAMERIGAFFHDVLIPAVETVIGWIQSFVAQFRSGEGEVSGSAGKLREVIGQLAAAFSAAFGAIQAVVVTVVDFIRGFWRVFGDDLRAFTREFVAGILETVRGLLNALSGIFDLIKAILTGRWGEAWQALKKIVDGVWDAIVGVVRNAVTNVIPTILAGLGQAVASVAGSAFDGLKESFRAAINWIIDKWNDFKIPGVEILGKQVTPEINFPNLPRFHQGGIVPGRPGQEVPAILEAGERVIPANRAAPSLVVNVASQADAATIAAEIMWAMKTAGV